MLYTVRSERLLMEQLQYNLLFRWFVGLGMDDPVWGPTVFSKNRDRLLEGDIAAAFFDAVVDQAKAAGLLSDEHFTVDGTQLEAWASLKRFKRRGAPASDPPDDPGTAEREAALIMLAPRQRRHRTLGGDKNYDVPSFVEATRELNVTPHVAQKVHYTAIDGRTTRHPGYLISQRKRKLVEQAFGWMKTIGLLRKLRHRGGERVDWIMTFTAAAYNLVRLRTLLAEA